MTLAGVRTKTPSIRSVSGSASIDRRLTRWRFLGWAPVSISHPK
jgi:hypothetical protein